ncbi:hypothetical protein Scep_027776 [Stephania cephalantha]|uniref:Uncharacterized protein n=1 Tax=Stephania cephalantha TaxID=152367 RepID=A0AAP0HIU6_9MAGN
MSTWIHACANATAPEKALLLNPVHVDPRGQGRRKEDEQLSREESGPAAGERGSRAGRSAAGEHGGVTADQGGGVISSEGARSNGGGTETSRARGEGGGPAKEEEIAFDVDDNNDNDNNNNSKRGLSGRERRCPSKFHDSDSCGMKNNAAATSWTMAMRTDRRVRLVTWRGDRQIDELVCEVFWFA